jgi:mono/diheme cytochrome c family protein
MRMPSINKIFAATAIIMLAVLAIAPLKDRFAEWRGWQSRYNAYVNTLPVKVKQAEPGLKQIWARDLGRIDRCVTCHLGIDEPALAKAPEPFRAHPKIPHHIEDFGCTACHGGEGVATTFNGARGAEHTADHPFIPLNMIEAGCGRCHKEATVDGAPLLNKGRALLAKYKCAGCHNLPGTEKPHEPPLMNLGTKTNRDWLVRWLEKPRAWDPATSMPTFMLTRDDASAVADYLMTQKHAMELDSLPTSTTAADKLVEEGEKVFNTARCISCHAINGRGGHLAVDLGKAGSKLNPVWTYNYIRNPKRFFPGVGMPRYRFSVAEAFALTMYIKSVFVDPDAGSDTVPIPAAKGFASVEHGRELVTKFNCAGCHGGGAESAGPDLTNIGNKPVEEIEFAQTPIEHSLVSYLDEKLRAPRSFGTATRMPSFSLMPDERRALSTALLANTTGDVPASFVRAAQPVKQLEAQGTFGKLARDLACTSCHVINGAGYLLATDLSAEGSSAHQDWIKGYFSVPYSLRPILTERMPNFYLPDSEATTLTNYLTSVMVRDSLDAPIPAGDTTEGHKLYVERFACNACHQIGGRGGYVGPPLDGLSKRLKPGWVYRYIKNPRALRANTIEPQQDVTDSEAASLTAWLMTLHPMESTR